MSEIEWTEKTWNPISGCSRKSAGCENCYAEKMTKRLEAMGLEKYAGLLNAQGRFNGTVRLDENALLEPLKRKKPTTYFVNSMSDLFHENVPDAWIDKIFAVMALCPQHTFQILTKRADRMSQYCSEYREREVRHAASQMHLYHIFNPCIHRYVQTLPNVWLGVSVENQKAADERIPLLLDTPAAIRFLSCEPLLDDLDLRPFIGYERYAGNVPGHCVNIDGETHHADGHKCRTCGWGYPNDPDYPNRVQGIDWAIVGGESGANARPCNVDWIRSVVAQCKVANVPVFVKQLGSYAVSENDYDDSRNIDRGTPCAFGTLLTKNRKGGDPDEWPEDLRIRKMPQQK